MKNFFKKMCLAVTLLAGCLLSAQTIITGADIPDATAQRLYLLSASNQSSTQQQDYFGNSAQLTPDDSSVATAAVSVYASQVSNAVNLYNQSVGADGSGFTSAKLATLQTSQANATATAMASMQHNMSAAGYTALTANIEYSKNNMLVQTMSSGGMGCCYSEVTSFILHNPGASHYTLTETRTVEGVVQTAVAPGPLHTGIVRMNINGHTSTVSTSAVAPNVYLTTSNAVTLDSVNDSCLLGGGCTDQSVSQVECSQVGLIYVTIQWPQVELAYTRALYTGRIFACWEGKYGIEYCAFYVEDWCTSGSTPPDNSFNGETIDDQKVPAYSGWDNESECIKFPGWTHWACSHGLSKGLKGQLAHASCTSHP